MADGATGSQALVRAFESVPAEAPLALIRGRHRFRLLVHGRRNSDMQAFVRSMLERGPKERRSIQVQVDVDPQSFL